jgi:hypothetical protein
MRSGGESCTPRIPSRLRRGGAVADGEIRSRPRQAALAFQSSWGRLWQWLREVRRHSDRERHRIPCVASDSDAYGSMLHEIRGAALSPPPTAGRVAGRAGLSGNSAADSDGTQEGRACPGAAVPAARHRRQPHPSYRVHTASPPLETSRSRTPRGGARLTVRGPMSSCHGGLRSRRRADPVAAGPFGLIQGSVGPLHERGE